MSNQHYIYLGRIDGKLWLAGPTDQERPEIDSRLIHQSIPYQIKKEAEVGVFIQGLATLPRIEYLGQETDFQMYQAVPFEQIFTDYQVYSGNKWVDVDYSEYVKAEESARRHVAYGIPKEEPAATIQAIREATERHTTSPEAAREFLQEAGIEKEDRELTKACMALSEPALREGWAENPTAEDVLKNHIPFEHRGSFETFFKAEAIAAMQEYTDLQTASLQAEKAELLEALRMYRKEDSLYALSILTDEENSTVNALLSKHTK